MNKLINNDFWLDELMYTRLLLVSTWVSMTWNMSAPLPDSRLGILMSTVEPGSLLGPLFMAWNHIAQGTERDGDEGKRSEYSMKNFKVKKKMHLLYA